jgi:hypothetical protein
MVHGTTALRRRNGGHPRKAGSVRVREDYHRCSIEERPHGCAKGRRWTRHAAQKGACSGHRPMKDSFLFSAIYRQLADS